MEKKIAWEKWENPFKNYEEEEDEEVEYQDSYQSELQVAQFVSPHYEFMDAIDNMYDLWVGHTNFNITNKEKDIIESVEGVESLDVMTRYRFRVSIGKMFVGADVKNNIQKKICQPIDIEPNKNLVPSIELREKVEILVEEISKDYPYWAIFMFPNGKLVYTGDNKLSQSFLDEVELYKETRGITNGLIVTSWNNSCL